MNDLREAAFTASRFKNGDAYIAFVATIDALIRREHDAFVSAESDTDIHRIQGAIRRLTELKKLISITASE